MLRYLGEDETPYSPVIIIENPNSSGVTWTASELNVRVPVQLSPQEAPDPIRQGATPARQAKNQVATFFYDQGFWSSDRFEAGQIIFGSPNADRPRGDQAVWRERVNTQPPQYQAYGSLFQSTEPLYGMG